MGLVYDEFELTESAYRHGYDGTDFAEMLHRRHLVIRNRRGRLVGYEILGRNSAGEYPLAAGRVVELLGVSTFRVFHLARMNTAERRRFKKVVGI
jgi:hypothetical protein